MAGPYEPQPDPTAAPPPAAPPPAVAPLPPVEVPAPTAETPQYQTPQYQTPEYQAPQYQTPEYQAPQQPAAQYPPVPYPPAQYPQQAQLPPLADPGTPTLPPVQPPAGQGGGQYPLPGSYPTVPPYPAPERSRTKARLGRTGIAVAVAVVLLILRVVFASATSNHSTSNLPNRVTLPQDQWADTAAESYPVDTAGIQLPTATPVDGFTADEVTADLQTVKKILVAGRLDDTLLVKHDPSVLLGLLSPGYRPKAQSRFDSHEFTYYGTQIAPGQRLVGAIRDKGSITFTGRANSNGVRVLDVTTNFVWVYAFDGVYKEPGDHLVSIHDTNTWEFPSAQDVDADQVGAWVHDLNYSVYNMDCDLMDKDYLGLGKPVDLPTDSSADPRAEDAKALDPNTPVDTNVGAGTC